MVCSPGMTRFVASLVWTRNGFSARWLAGAQGGIGRNALRPSRRSRRLYKENVKAPLASTLDFFGTQKHWIGLVLDVWTESVP